MSDYYREQGFRSRKRIVRRLRVVAIVLLLAILIGVGLLAYDIYRQSKQSDAATDMTTAVTSTVVSSTETQASNYFQFRTPLKWRAVPNETRDGHYVYRQFNGTLVEQELVVDVNNQTPEILPAVQTTRIIPVSISANGALVIDGGVSEHCKKYLPKGANNNQQITTFKTVSFACNPDGTQYVVAVGLKGGNTLMTLPRPNGSTATYKITYMNLSASQTIRDAENIIETFETR